MTLGTAVPTPAYNNVAIAPQFYAPSYFQVSNIQFGATTQITITANFGRTGNFVVGQQVLFDIPQPYGTFQLTGQKGVVTEIVDSTNFKVSIDTRVGYSTFIPSPSPTPRQIPQVIPAGTFSTNTQIGTAQLPTTNLSDITLPGSFTNTQPNVGL